MTKTRFDDTPRLNRRAALIAAGAALAAPALALRPAPARAETMEPPAIAPYRRFRLGNFTVTTLLAGARAMEAPQTIFGLNASAEEFTALAEANFIPADKMMNGFTPTLVETGAEVILFDTGLAPEGIAAALAAAGRSPDQVTLVVLSHMHGDHIGGLMADGAPTFPNAAYVTSQQEFDHWAGAGNEGFEAKVRPLAEKMRFIGDGDEVVGGIQAMLTPGHTPGHMTFALESAGAALMLGADTTNHFVWSLQRPDWEVKFDMDKAQAAASRARFLDRLATDRMPFVGYHMPFPGLGHVERHAGSYRFVPVAYQLDL